MSFFTSYLGVVAVWAFFSLFWLISLRTRDVSIVDILWGLGFSLLAVVTLFSEERSVRYTMVTCLVCLWGARLSLYLFLRNHGKPEDRRYQEIRAGYGDKFGIFSLFIIFWFQALLISIVSLPILFAKGPDRHVVLFVLGIVLWVIGFLFEAIGDWQLARFKKQPSNAGKVLNSGLWKYTRHPNYFGDFLIWWGHFCVAVSAGAPVWTIVGPLLMSWLLLRFSGVVLLESTITSRRPGYAEYIDRTSAFFPWFPKGG